MSRQGSPRAALLFALVAALLAPGACTAEDDGPVTVQPGAPGEPGRVLTEGPQPGDQPYTPADVWFLQAMIPHHGQALRMTALVPDRTGREDIALFAERVEISQEAEITQMQGWLEARDEEVPAADHDHQGQPDLMPGMLTEAQFAELEQATGAEFDRRFLESMISHHEGALTMIDDLLVSGGAQATEIFQMVTHMEADQGIEIDRMNDLLAELDAA